MLAIGKTLVSLDILTEDFICNLSACKGACCEEGTYGAPLLDDEVTLIQQNMETIKPYMTEEAVEFIKDKNFWQIDPENEPVTQTLRGQEECVFAKRDAPGGIWKCTIEQAYKDDKSTFLKPKSCHLYPIRLSTVGEYVALNYDRWDICSPACTFGKEHKTPVYIFLKEPLIRAFGEDWYKELEQVATEYLASIKTS